jgi:hypothetical protein
MNIENEEIIDSICNYAEKYQIKALLQEYLRRLILAKPADPLNFLIKTILENPVTGPMEEGQAEPK